MKIIRYMFRCGTDEDGKEILAEKTLKYNEFGLSIAQTEACNGEYTIEGEDEPETPTQLDIIEAQVTYTAMMTNTLLEV